MKNVFTMNVANGVTEFVKVATSPDVKAIDFSAATKVQERVEKANDKAIKAFNKIINVEIKKVAVSNEFHVFDTVKAFESDKRESMVISSVKGAKRHAAKKVTAAIANASNSVADVRASRATKDAIANMRNHGDKDFTIDYDVIGNEVIAVMAKPTDAKVEIGTTVSKVFSNARMAEYSKVAIVDILRQVGVTENGVEIYRPQVLKSVAGALFQAELMNRIGDHIMNADVRTDAQKDNGTVLSDEEIEAKRFKVIDGIETRLNAIHESAKASWLTFELSKLTGVETQLDDNGFAVFTMPLDMSVAIQFASIIMAVFIEVTQLIEVVKTTRKTKKSGEDYNRYEVRLCDGVMDELRDNVIKSGKGKRTGSVFIGVDVPKVDQHFMLSSSHDVYKDKVGMVVNANSVVNKESGKVVGEVVNEVDDKVAMVVGGNTKARYGNTSVLVDAINNLQSTKLKVDTKLMDMIDYLEVI